VPEHAHERRKFFREAIRELVGREYGAHVLRASGTRFLLPAVRQQRDFILQDAWLKHVLVSLLDHVSDHVVDLPVVMHGDATDCTQAATTLHLGVEADAIAEREFGPNS
jgi:hypothetical protein